MRLKNLMDLKLKPSIESNDNELDIEDYRMNLKIERVKR